MPLTSPCTRCEGSGKNQSLQFNLFSDDCEACDGSGEGHPLWGRKRFIQAVLEDGRRDIQYAPAYAEPGYEVPEGKLGILFANWNSLSRWNDKAQAIIETDKFMPRFEQIVEKLYECEWQDEWSTCSDCMKAYRTNPDGHWWRPSFAEIEDEELCIECVRKNAAGYLEKRIGDSKKAIDINLGEKALKAAGWVQVKTESRETPLQIERKLKAAGYKRFLFVGDDRESEIWVRPKARSEIEDLLANGEVSLRTYARSARAKAQRKQNRKKSFER
jgi:hypothetical protein